MHHTPSPSLPPAAVAQHWALCAVCERGEWRALNQSGRGVSGSRVQQTPNVDEMRRKAKQWSFHAGRTRSRAHAHSSLSSPCGAGRDFQRRHSLFLLQSQRIFLRLFEISHYSPLHALISPPTRQSVLLMMKKKNIDLHKTASLAMCLQPPTERLGFCFVFFPG